MKTIKTLALLTFVVTASALASGCIFVSDDDGDASLTIDNRSSVIFDTIEAARSDFDEPYEVIVVDLFPDDIVTIDFDCDFYDLRLTNEFGGQCEIFDLDLCFSDDLFVITDSNICTFANGRKVDLKTFATEKPATSETKSP
jgi:hypothetical protein